MSKNSLFLSSANRLYPGLAEMPAVEHAGTLVNIFTLLWTLPFALIGLIWLILATNLDTAVAESVTLFVLLVLGFLLRRFAFSLQLQLRKEAFASTRGSLESMVQWSAALLFGPTALWLGIIETTALFLFRWRRNHSAAQRLFYLSNYVASLAGESLGGLCGLWLYHQMGGVFPLTDLAMTALLPAVAATLVAWLVPILLSAVIFLFVLRTQEALVGADSFVGGSGLLQMFLATAVFQLPIMLFAILAAGLYSWRGIGLYLFLMAGVLLVSLLARGLSEALKRNEQRTRELTILEKLGEAIIAAPPDQTATAVPQLLAEHVHLMLPESDVAIWLYPDTMLLIESEGQRPLPQLATVKTQLQQTNEPFLLFDHVVSSLEDIEAYPRRATAVPIRSEDGAVQGGIYALERHNAEDIENSLPALHALASQIDLAIRRAEIYTQMVESERMARELEVAGRIQATFLPAQLPQIPGWQIAATLIPARQTSGDFYDFFELGNGRSGLLIADVADKGTGAALYMALSRTLIRTFALQNPAHPEIALRLANERILNDTMSDQFVTVFYGVIDQENGLLTYSNAGHNPAYLIRGTDNSVHEMGQSGIPLGMFPDMDWQQRQVQIQRSDLLLLYTDGVTEAQNSAQTLFGEQRLLDTIINSGASSAQNMAEGIVEAIQTFVDTAPQFDDITLIVALRD